MPDEQNQSKFENYSLDFDGSSQYIDLGTSIPPRFSSTGNGNTEPWTVSLWANCATAGNEPLIQFPFGVSVYTWYMFFFSGKISFGHRYGAALCTETNSGAAIQNQWNNIVVTFDGVDITNISSFKLYINGVDISITTRSHFGTNNTNVINIGRGFTSVYYEGKITQVSFFDYALTDGTGGTTNQIGDLYNSGTPVNPMALMPAPVAYYPLGGSSTGSSSSLTIPNESVPSATVFDFLAAPTYSRISLGTSDFIGNKSISFWLNKNANNGSVFAFGNTNYYPNVQSTTLQLNNGSITILSTGTINLNEWNHYVITGDGTTAKCYVNGVYKSTGTDRDISSAANWIGGQNNGTGMLNGELSNIQKWNAVLSDGGASIGDIAGGSISTLYNNGVPYTGTQPQAANLKGWWKMNVDTSTWNGTDWVIEDSSVTTKTPNYTKALSKTGYGPNYLNFKTTTSLTTSDELTSSFWVKTTQAGNIGIASGTVGMGPFVFANSSILIARAPNNYRYFTPRGSMSDGNWHHILVYSQVMLKQI